MVLLFLAEGFEEIEALTPVDILRRAGFDVKTAAVGGKKVVVGSHGIPVTADIAAEEALAMTDELEAVILPGGMPGAKNLDADSSVDQIVRTAAEKGILLAAICAAPLVLGRRGLLAGRRATCYPGFEKELSGATVTGGRTEIDGPFVTGCGMGAATEFALALLSTMKGEEAAQQMRASVLAR
ncbi:MAG: DJ-1/PfpI family protein [Clostridia bacterium]|jgi:4-methyl-5(b-hydroxyethyl)-thiazole monophosphate biosynthesis|nr:DJ-1/PfpI family protein [Clostridia bacterium]